MDIDLLSKYRSELSSIHGLIYSEESLSNFYITLVGAIFELNVIIDNTPDTEHQLYQEYIKLTYNYYRELDNLFPRQQQQGSYPRF